MQKSNGLIYNFKTALLLFVAWPFGGFLFALRNYRERWAQVIVTLFCGFYGFTFVFWNETADFNRYKNYFAEYTRYDFYMLWQRISTLYTQNAEREDIAVDIINYAVSRFTDNPRYLYAVVGMIFGYFYSKNIWFLLRHAPRKINQNARLFLIGFLTIVPVFYISSFPMHLAMHIFFFGAINILMYRRYKYFGYILLSILVHFSFIFPAVVLLGLCVAGLRLKLYLAIFLFSLVIREINLELLAKYASFFGSAIEHKIDGYTDIDYMQEVNDYETNERSWFMIWRFKFLLYYTWGILLYMTNKLGNRLPQDMKAILAFCLLMSAATNFLSEIPSMGRFYSLYLLMAMALLFIHHQRQNTPIFENSTIIGIFPVAFWIVVLMRTHILVTISPELFYSNFPASVFFHNAVRNLQSLF